jgi:hypothetical protein
MSMKNTDRNFYGQQEGERILYVIHPHPFATVIALLKVYVIALIIALVLVMLGSAVAVAMGAFALLALILFILTVSFGTKIIFDWAAREIAYITDRRIVRFEPTTLFATNTRTLAWDEVVKVKTYPPNFIWKQLAIGTVAVHGRTSIRTFEDIERGTSTVDDIEIRNVYLYRDLGNYIDKILYTYKQMPADVYRVREFIPKPKGERY